MVGDYSGGMKSLPQQLPELRFYKSKHSEQEQRHREVMEAAVIALLAGGIGLILLYFILLPALLVLGS
jgi:hypothetical protein